MKQIALKSLFSLTLSFTFAYASTRIIILAPERWEEYKELRLQALSNDPEALAIAKEDEESKPESYWREKLVVAQNKRETLLFFAEQEGKLVGTVGAAREYQDVTYCRHLVSITGMYVAPQIRGQGVGSLLMQTVLSELEKHSTATVAMLWVTATKKAAIALYEKNGFVSCGVLPKSVLVKDQCYDSLLMYKMINSF
jgi:ribosomal protein S18 acetylase RimI-like enzyme